MSHVNFGTVLREAREQRGYDLIAVARKLRIRSDILRAIEDSDFSHMPPHGYARNMISAYANLVGLNPTEITRMYLDDAYAYQVGAARTETRPTSYANSKALTQHSARERTTAQSTEHFSRRNSFNRTTYSDRREYNHTEKPPATMRQEHLYSGNYMHPSRHTALPNSQYTNFYAGPQAPSTIRSKFPWLIAVVVILVLLVVVLVLAFGNRGVKPDDVPKVPITGVTDTTQNNKTEDEAGVQEPSKSSVKPPTKVTVEYKVDSGKEIYAVITDKDTVTPQMITGPVTDIQDVSSTWSFATWIPEAVHITVDGKPVKFETTNEDGMPMCAVDFQAYLEAWRTEHPDASSAATDTASAPPATTTASTE